MPLKPLSKIPLTFLLDRDVEIGASPYDILPWTNGPFRRLCGLKPLKLHDGETTDEANLEGPIDQFVEISEGFVLTDEAMQSMSDHDRQFFTPEARQKITHFFTEVRKHGEQLREAQVKPKNKKRARKNKNVSTTASGDTSDEETFVDRVENIPGYDEFKGASLAMQNRAGGVIAETIKIMKDMDRTPMVAWKHFVYTSQVLPSRSAKKLTDEELKRHEDIQAKKAELQFHNPPGIGKFLDDRLVARVAGVLFGAEAFMESTEILWPCFNRATRSTIRRAWEREMRKGRKTLKRANKLKKEYQGALQAARESPCPRLLHKVSKKLKDWKGLAEITGESTESSFAASTKGLEDLWSDLGFSSDPNETGGNLKGRRNGKRALRALATPEQMEAAYASYREHHFCEMEGAMNEITEVLKDLQEGPSSDLDSTAPISVDLLQGIGSGDLGIEEFARSTMTEMLRKLGIIKPGALPLASEHLELKWHQLVGDAIMLKRMFTSELGDAPVPTLLCDDVGLGKTAQILGVISMLVHCYELQEAGKPLPPLLAESARVYFAGMEKIPQLPSVILVPLGLVPQWYQQLKYFTIDGAFQVIEYATQQFNSVTFFEAGGPWYKHCAGKNCHRTIIILPMPASAVATEAKKHIAELDKSATGRNRAFRGEIVKIGDDIPTILNKKFLFFACDEIHNFRNLSWGQLGAQQISSNSFVRVGATATPIIHGSRDALAIGRILRLDTMIGSAGYELGTNMLKSEQARRRLYKSERGTEAGASASDSGDQTEEISSLKDNFLAQRLATINASRHRTFFIHSEAIDMAKKELIPIIIRRTGDSKDPDGKEALGLGRYYESIAWSPQRQHEMEAVERLMDALLNCKSKGDTKEMQIIWKARNFLLDHKKTLFHWLLKDRSPDDPDFWMTWTSKSLEEDASSKILTTIALAQHYQQPNAKPLFFNVDGTRDLAKEAGCDCKTSDKPRKVIIFVMYTIHRKIMKRALSLVGLESVEYDGRMTTEMRDEALKRFEASDNLRVLLISNVGTTGLNLTMASVIIFLSGLWSGMEIKQTIGRVWRAGQLLSVIVHHILAPGTADVILAGLAGDKVLMLDHLYEAKNIANKVFNAQVDQDDSDSDWQGEDEGPSSKSRNIVKSKAAVRPRKANHQRNTQPKPIDEPEAHSELSQVEGSGRGGASGPAAGGGSRISQKNTFPSAHGNKDEHEDVEQKENSDSSNNLKSKRFLGQESDSAGADERPTKRARTLSFSNDSSVEHVRSTTPPANHIPVSPPEACPPPETQSLSQTRSFSPAHTLSPSNRTVMPAPSSHGSSSIYTQQENDELICSLSIHDGSAINNDGETALTRPSLPTSSAPKSLPWFANSDGSSSQGPHDPRFVEPVKQMPGQFKRRGASKPAVTAKVSVTAKTKPYARNTGAMRSPSPSACAPVGTVLRSSSSPSPPPSSKGKGKQT